MTDDLSVQDREDIVMEAQHITKLYGINKGEAAEQMKAGSEKDLVYKKTGVTVALWDVSLQVKRGEIFVIIGLSGSGKSTIIRCFNQLLKPTSGGILFEGQRVDQLGKRELLEFRRNKVSMIFQNFGLLTHRNVLENVAYGLEVKGVSREERTEKSMELIKQVGLEGWETQPISSLSGGMKQRVGIARALASDPEVLLMDEPFSALDPLVRQDMQFELLSLQRKLGKTVIFITHDMDEAFKLGDRVAIMRDGKIIQIDTPQVMSAHPADEYVAKFIDSADKSKVLTARNIMNTPTCLVRETDPMEHALRAMRTNGVSSAFVVDGQMRLQGILPLESALQAKRETLPMADIIVRECLTVSLDTAVNDLLSLAAQARYPIAVLEDGRLKGIISKAAVLASLG